MTDAGDRPVRHCAECAGEKPVTPVESPGGETYRVCESCAPAIEQGEAIVVIRRE